MGWTWDWSWTARRLAISAFLAWQLAVTAIWVCPECPLRRRCVPVFQFYVLPLGLWQSWAMFAPDPIRETVVLESEVIDKNGVRYAFSFPRLNGFTWWQGIPRFRYSKYAANLSADEFAVARECAARHVLRQLRLPADVYPVSVHLIYQLRAAPPIGASAEPDPMAPTKPYVIGTIRVDSSREVIP